MRCDRSDMVDAMAYAFMKIQPSKIWPKHPTRKYKVIFKAHPLVVRLCWVLRRWIWIKPWVEAFYPDDADGIYMREHNTLFVGERTYSLLKYKGFQSNQSKG